MEIKIKPLIILLIGFSLSACTVIKPGEIGVRTNNISGVSQKPLTEGWAFYLPKLHRIDIYNFMRLLLYFSPEKLLTVIYLLHTDIPKIHESLSPR